jgi:phosphatidylglycerol---prolipoprotein diacylglyceryl transferase
MFIHNFDPVLLDLGLVQIRWYSLAYIFGIITGWVYAIKIIKFTKKNDYDFKTITVNQFDNLIVYLVLGIVLGGRLGYVLFYNFNYYSQNIIEIFKLWQGGMSFHGGLLGVIFSIFIFAKKNNVSFYKISDIISCVAPIGIFFGRIANFINGELYGKPSALPWSVIFPNGGGVSRHPSQIYEALLEGLILFFLLNYLALKKEIIFKVGHISIIFLISYSVLRIVSEIFREPDNNIGFIFNYFSMGTLLSFLTIFSGILIILHINKNE